MASWLLDMQRRLVTPPARRLPAADLRPAAVLVPLYVEAGELWTVLTRRNEDLRSHRGQFAFPGGAREVGEEAWPAALREAEEELGIVPATVMPLGELDEVDTPTGWRVSPWVGAVPSPLAPRPNPLEVAEVLPLPLSAFSGSQIVEEREVSLDGEVRRILVYHVGSRQIWGVTARILENLLVRVGLGLPGGADYPPDEAS